MQIQENISLAPFTTLAIGGPARFFARATTAEDVAAAVRFADERRLSLFVLGGGSNLVVSDHGWNGLVLQIALDGIATHEDRGRTLLDAGAGVFWDEFVALAVSQNLAGVECLSGIPGTVGGTPVQNVGAYGQEVSQTIVSLSAFDIARAETRELSAADCGFSYRSSTFNTGARGRYIILRVTFALTRADKGMIIDPADPESRSAGSFFKNPVLADGRHRQLVATAHTRGLRVPSYPALSQQRKVSAAWLVENSGFHKGFTSGRVGISSKHALAIVNRGGATAGEVVALKDQIQRRVRQQWDIWLEPEPVFIGF